jgi:hypothetical protein
MMAGWQRADNVLFELIDGRAVLIDAAGREFITLNRVGSLVWQALDGRRGTPELARELSVHFEEVPIDTLEHDISTFLTTLADLALVSTGTSA